MVEMEVHWTYIIREQTADGWVMDTLKPTLTPPHYSSDRMTTKWQTLSQATSPSSKSSLFIFFNFMQRLFSHSSTFPQRLLNSAYFLILLLLSLSLFTSSSPHLSLFLLCFGAGAISNDYSSWIAEPQPLCPSCLPCLQSVCVSQVGTRAVRHTFLCEMSDE